MTQHNTFYVEEASALWKDIKERQEGLSIVSYYGKLKVIWDELINYEQFPLCKCGKCVCDIAGKLEKKREEERVHQFLMGLKDKTYGQTRSNLLAMDPLPTLNKVYSTVIQEESLRDTEGSAKIIPVVCQKTVSRPSSILHPELIPPLVNLGTVRL
ncbi:hypothetical protein Tco_1417472 [Tanacetum coccineum]